MEEEKITFKDWDPAEWIETKEAAIVFIEGAFEEDDPQLTLDMLADVARSKGFKELVEEIENEPAEWEHNLRCENTLSFPLLVKTLDHLGFRLGIRPKKSVPVVA